MIISGYIISCVNSLRIPQWLPPDHDRRRAFTKAARFLQLLFQVMTFRIGVVPFFRPFGGVLWANH